MSEQAKDQMINTLKVRVFDAEESTRQVNETFQQVIQAVVTIAELGEVKSLDEFLEKLQDKFPKSEDEGNLEKLEAASEE